MDMHFLDIKNPSAIAASGQVKRQTQLNAMCVFNLSHYYPSSIDGCGPFFCLSGIVYIVHEQIKFQKSYVLKMKIMLAYIKRRYIPYSKAMITTERDL